MYSKAIPKPLQLTPRRFLKHSKSTQSYDAKSSGTSVVSSLQNADISAETDRQSTWTWEVLEDSPPYTDEFSPQSQDPVLPSPKSSAKIKRWLLRRKTSTVETTPPTTAPADLDSGFSSYHARRALDLKVEVPQLSPEELAKVNAFYAPTPILPETPAPRTGKVHPPWSPDIDCMFKPKRSASVGFRSINTTDVEHGFVDVKLSNQSERSQNLSDQIPMFLRSETTRQKRVSNTRPGPAITPSRGEANWRHQRIYRKDTDKAYSNIEDIETEGDDADEHALTFDTDQECDDSCISEPVTPLGGKLFFIMGDSPIEDSGVVTLRFVKGHCERPFSSGREIDMPSSRPSSPLLENCL